MVIKRIIIVLSLMFIVTVGTAYAAGDPEAGKTKTTACASCHGENGEGIDETPPLAGLEESYQVEQLKAYKDGTREDPMMQMFTSQMSEQDMADIAAYYVTLSKD